MRTNQFVRAGRSVPKRPAVASSVTRPWQARVLHIAICTVSELPSRSDSLSVLAGGVAESCFEFGHALGKTLVFFARLGGHVAHDVEFLALHELEIVDDALDLALDQSVDLAPTPWAAPAALVISLASSSKKREEWWSWRPSFRCQARFREAGFQFKARRACGLTLLPASPQFAAHELRRLHRLPEHRSRRLLDRTLRRCAGMRLPI